MSTESSRPVRRVRRAAAVPAAAAALVVLAAASASAHVTVHGPGAHEGGSATLTFKVPNEEANASTKQVEIDLPTDTPLSGVTASAPSGWTSQVTADKVVFSGGTISGDDSVQFPIKVDKLPMSPTVVFKALQTYSDGTVVRWIEQAPAGAPEPAHPAPTLKLLPPVSSDSMAGMSMKSSTPGTGSTAAPNAAAAPTAKAATKNSTPAPSKVKAGDGGQAMVSAHDDGDDDSDTAAAPAGAPSKVHAGTGGQASEGSASVPVVPVVALVAGLGVAGAAARRLVRR